MRSCLGDDFGLLSLNFSQLHIVCELLLQFSCLIFFFRLPLELLGHLIVLTTSSATSALLAPRSRARRRVARGLLVDSNFRVSGFCGSRRGRVRTASYFVHEGTPKSRQHTTCWTGRVSRCLLLDSRIIAVLIVEQLSVELLEIVVLPLGLRLSIFVGF